MNASNFFATVFLVASTASAAIAQENFPPPDNGYYVVIGTFAVRENAGRFLQKQNKEGIAARCFFHAPTRLYYVYHDVFEFEERKDAIALAVGLQQTQPYHDAWVMRIPAKPGVSDPSMSYPPPAAEDFKPAPDADTMPILPVQNTLRNTEAFLSLYDARTNKVVQGNVKVINTDNGRLLEEVPGNEYVMLPTPQKGSGTISLLCDVIGYRKIQTELNIADPLSDSTGHVELMGTTLVVHFDLVEYRRGDIFALYNVYFYNDAAIMMNESRFQLNEVLDMLHARPTMKIRLHGHTNGNYYGKIITPATESNFFSLSKSVTQEETGSARTLSQKRAQMVRNYLVANGISADRIEVISWGGKRPVHDKNSVHARKNMRVEVEILEE